jgi:hypothetical protein
MVECKQELQLGYPKIELGPALKQTSSQQAELHCTILSYAAVPRGLFMTALQKLAIAQGPKIS